MGGPCEFPRVFLSSGSCKPQLHLQDEIFGVLGLHEVLEAKDLFLRGCQASFSCTADIGFKEPRENRTSPAAWLYFFQPKVTHNVF